MAVPLCSGAAPPRPHLGHPWQHREYGGVSAQAPHLGEGPREAIGVNRANPLPLLLPAIDLLDAEGQKPFAQRILTAVERVLTERRALTPDLGGQAGTTEMSEAIIAALK